MTIKFYVNGAQVDTYKCAATSTAELTQEDEEAITKCKQSAYRNFGYPAIMVVDPKGE